MQNQYNELTDAEGVGYPAYSWYRALYVMAGNGVGENIGVGEVANAWEGRTAENEQLAMGERVWNGIVGVGQVALTVLDMREGGQLVKSAFKLQAQAAKQLAKGKIADVVDDIPRVSKPSAADNVELPAR